ncbi:MAG: VOC family protein [Nocardioidaceae bacterium]
MTGRLNLITLGVADLERSAAFYTSLGFERPAGPEGIVFLRTTGSVLALFPRDELAADVGVPAEGSGFRGVTLAANQDSRADVDTAFAAWVEAGATPVKQPEAVFWGGYSGYVADPDGHLWELAHNPASDDNLLQLQPDGSMVLRG